MTTVHICQACGTIHDYEGEIERCAFCPGAGFDKAFVVPAEKLRTLLQVVNMIGITGLMPDCIERDKLAEAARAIEEEIAGD